MYIIKNEKIPEDINKSQQLKKSEKISILIFFLNILFLQNKKMLYQKKVLTL